MARYKEIKEKIEQSYQVLPKNQRKIADYFINNFDDISFQNVHEVSKATGASVASIVRFSQRVGFSGYSQLRDAIAGVLKYQLNNKDIFPLLESKKLKDDLLTTVANLDIKNINDTLSIIDRENFNSAVNLILKSKRVYTAGLGISYLLAEILAYQLTQVAVDSTVLKHSHTLFHEQILFLNKADLIITFSFPPYSKETVDAAKYAHERGIKVISITNKDASPITFYSNFNLIVKSENMLFTNSFAAISVLINAIATACAYKNKDKAKKILEETGEIMEDQRLVIL